MAFIWLSWLGWLGILALAYLLGSIPSGLWIGRFIFGIDVRQFGSGRTGATNVLRTMGKKAAIAAFVLDALKAVVAVGVARLVFPDAPWLHVLAALAVAAGHNWPIFAGFRGGRGVVVSVMAMAVMFFPVAVMIIVVGIVVISIWRYVSLGSIIGALIAPFASIFFYLHGDMPLPYLVYAFLGCILVVGSHQANIKRLLAGTESRLGQRAQMTTQNTAGATDTAGAIGATDTPATAGATGTIGATDTPAPSGGPTASTAPPVT